MSAATVTPIHPVDRQDPRIESWLDAHHVDWTWHPDLELDTIDIRRSLANQARPGEALLPDTVELYVAGYRNGDLFPPIVVRKTSRQAKKLVVIDGNHRIDSTGPCPKPPHRAYRLVLDLHADTLDDLSSALTHIDLALRSGRGVVKATDGGPDSGWHWELTEQPKTHAEYVAELTAWRAKELGIPTGWAG